MNLTVELSPGGVRWIGAIGLSLLILAAGCLISLVIQTSRDIALVKGQLASASDYRAVEARLGTPKGEWNDQNPAPTWLVEKLGRPLAPGEAAYQFNREGLPYWSILVLVGSGGEIVWFEVDYF